MSTRMFEVKLGFCSHAFSLHFAYDWVKDQLLYSLY